MSGGLKVVFLKEVLDNFRDRRTLLSALLLGPLFGPILFAFVINLSLKQSLTDANEVLEVPVIGSEHAPNLLRFLESRNIQLADAPVDRQAAMRAVRDGVRDVVVIIPESIAEDLAEAIP
ncbi:MAG: ABC transporter permease, partial [Gammaproteobacteria bacterium]|nr:ABC transporter permease [Gammaproteobacteria bacterium]